MGNRKDCQPSDTAPVVCLTHGADWETGRTVCDSVTIRAMRTALREAAQAVVDMAGLYQLDGQLEDEIHRLRDALNARVDRVS